jgi:hypothetical protein
MYLSAEAQRAWECAEDMALNMGYDILDSHHLQFSLGIGDRSLAARPVRIDPTKVRCV